MITQDVMSVVANSHFSPVARVSALVYLPAVLAVWEAHESGRLAEVFETVEDRLGLRKLTYEDMRW